jgi:P-loop containing NTP hydrolase pore-1
MKQPPSYASGLGVGLRQDFTVLMMNHDNDAGDGELNWSLHLSRFVDMELQIIFDECHRAKNLNSGGLNGKGTKTGRTVVELQKRLPNARIVYASATGA